MIAVWTCLATFVNLSRIFGHRWIVVRGVGRCVYLRLFHGELVLSVTSAYIFLISVLSFMQRS